MLVQIICVVVLASSVQSRNVPDYGDLDENEQMLFRAAYDSYDSPSYSPNNPSYSHDAPSYNYDTPSYSYNEIPTGKLDLLKDGIWALKAKMLELKAFDKALAANLLLMKTQVKELMQNLKPLKKHQHVDVDKKPAYNYQPPSSSYTQYEQSHPHYTVPQNNAPQYSTPAPQYNTPAHHYGAQQQAHDPYYGH